MALLNENIVRKQRNNWTAARKYSIYIIFDMYKKNKYTRKIMICSWHFLYEHTFGLSRV